MGHAAHGSSGAAWWTSRSVVICTQPSVQDLASDPLHKSRHLLDLTGRAEIASLAAEGQQVLLATPLTADASEAVAEDPALRKTNQPPSPPPDAESRSLVHMKEQ